MTHKKRHPPSLTNMLLEISQLSNMTIRNSYWLHFLKSEDDEANQSKARQQHTVPAKNTVTEGIIPFDPDEEHLVGCYYY